jgi:ribose-phosphate pyrophosphokinase
MPELKDEIKLLTGSSNRPLAQKIAEYLEMPLSGVDTRRFSDGEIFIKINENVRGRDVFIIQSTNSPADNLMELLLMIDACSRASAKWITAVIPYYGYARQDRKDQPRVPISAKLVANLITAAGADRVVNMDLHAAQVQGFFDIPSDHLFSSRIFNEYISKMKIPGAVVVSPDVGSIKMARAFAKYLETPLAIIDKRRPEPNRAEVLNLIGEVEGKNVILRDDIIDTAGTLAEAATELKKKGALEIYACCTHALLSGEAVLRINESPLKELIVTDTIDPKNHPPSDKIKYVSAAAIFGEAISRIHNGESISILFDQ